MPYLKKLSQGKIFTKNKLIIIINKNNNIKPEIFHPKID